MEPLNLVLNAGPSKRWRTFRQKAKGEAVTDDQRRVVEDEERKKQVRLLIDVVMQARLPVSEKVMGRDPYQALRHIAGSRRSSTIRQRLRVWCKVRDWTQKAYGVNFPTSDAMMVEYLDDVFDGGLCSYIPRGSGSRSRIHRACWLGPG